MGFFSDLKEDLSQAVNELMPEDEQTGTDEMPAEEAAEVSLDEMLKNIDEIQLPEEEVQQEAEEGSAEFLTRKSLRQKRTRSWSVCWRRKPWQRKRSRPICRRKAWKRAPGKSCR